MKRRKFEKHLKEQGCILHHHGGNHDVWLNPRNQKRAPVKRHSELNPTYVKLVCKQLQVPDPDKF